MAASLGLRGIEGCNPLLQRSLSGPILGRLSTRRAFCAHARHRGRSWWPEAWDEQPRPEEPVITIFTADGQISRFPPVSLAGPSRPMQLQAVPTPQEQGLCIGSVFTISATNGVDPTRRMNVLGWCQSVEHLHETVEATVVGRGGEVFKVRREVKSGIQECLTMTLALPFLWGVPPEHERLRSGIELGGGIIDRVVREFFILP